MSTIETYCNVNVVPNDIPEFLEYLEQNDIRIVEDTPIDREVYHHYRISAEELNATRWLKSYIVCFKSKAAFKRFKDRPNVDVGRRYRKGSFMRTLHEKHYGNDYYRAWWNCRKEKIRLADVI